MSLGPLGVIGSAAGSPLPAKSADAERVQQETTDQMRQTQAEQRAEMAAGVGHTEQHEQASDRDADGRRLWEKTPEREANDDGAALPDESPTPATPRGKDPSGQTGQRLDVNG